MSGDFRLCILILWPLLGAGIGYRIGKKNRVARDYFADFVVIAEFLLVLAMFKALRGQGTPEFLLKGVCGLNLNLKLDGFREIYCTIAAFIWMMTTLISREYFRHYHNRNRYYAFVLPTLGATLGVFLSADLFTTFLFYQILSFTVFVGFAHDEKDVAVQAAQTYLAAELTGGCIVLMGLFRIYHLFGTLEIDAVKAGVLAMEERWPAYVAGALLFFGFGAKAGMFPLHFWMPRAHAGAPAPISTLLSSIITKTGVYGVLIVCGNIFFDNRTWGLFVIVLGTFTMLLGAFRALFDIHMKRILAFSSLSQIGFILIGVGAFCYLGEENQLAVRGTMLHMVNHSVIKLVLYLCAAIIYMKLHKLDLNEIRGYGHGKPLLHAAYLMGALGIAGIPFWNGYVSKTLLHEALVECAVYGSEFGEPVLILKVAEILFLLSGGITLAYMLKLYVCIFVERNPKNQEKYDELNGHYMGKLATVALIGAAVVPPALGMRPNLFLDRIADMGQGLINQEPLAHAVHYFSFQNMKGALISITVGILLYFLAVRKIFMRKNEEGVMGYVYLWPQWLDLEYILYRPIIFIIVPHICGVVCNVLDRPLLSELLKKIRIEPKWMKNRAQKRAEKEEQKKNEETKKRMGDHNKYR